MQTVQQLVRNKSEKFYCFNRIKEASDLKIKVVKKRTSVSNKTFSERFQIFRKLKNIFGKI